MDTPICDFVRGYAADRPARLHMPGHKGVPLLGPEPWDITEIPGADVLYRARGIIRESEENAARLFGSARTLYSAEGSSLCIRAMLTLVRRKAQARHRRPRIAAARNAHRTFLTAAALLGIDILWLYPEEEETGALSCRIRAEDLENALSGAEDPPDAVYVTSPDYLGNLAPLDDLARVCRSRGVLFLVDNAHGAYLRFLRGQRHPLACGADLCCDSAHKTLPVLTGGAYLHIGPLAPPDLADMAEGAMELFAGTSPSYLILQSLDAANRLLADGYPPRLEEAARRVRRLRGALSRYGWDAAGQEPLKLTLLPKSRGYTGTALAALLAENGISCEYADPDALVFMISPENTPEDLERLAHVLLALPAFPPLTSRAPLPGRPETVCSPREALLSPNEELPLERCPGRILAEPSVVCPPAVPIAVCGERLDEPALRRFAYYGISSCRVVREFPDGGEKQTPAAAPGQE